MNERNPNEAEYAYDIEVEVDDAVRNRISSVVSVLQENAKEYMDIDEKVKKYVYIYYSKFLKYFECSCIFLSKTNNNNIKYNNVIMI